MILNKKIEQWEESTGFKMSIDKTKVVIFYKDKRWVKEQEVNIQLNGEKIPIENKYKFLGVILDTHLNWAHQITYVKNKCKKALNIL